MDIAEKSKGRVEQAEEKVKKTGKYGQRNGIRHILNAAHFIIRIFLFGVPNLADTTLKNTSSYVVSLVLPHPNRSGSS